MPIYIFGRRADLVVGAFCLAALAGVSYAERDTQVATFDAEDLPKLQQAVGAVKGGSCELPDYRSGHDGYIKAGAGDLGACFQAALEPIKSQQTSFSQASFKDIDGQTIATVKCESGLRFNTQCHVTVNAQDAPPSPKTVYNISLPLAQASVSCDKEAAPSP